LKSLKKIKDRDVIIITNNALAASAITNSSAKLISTGGQYSDLSKSFVGDFATRIINMTYANLCILGVNGISSDFGVTTSVYQETMINELMVKRCNGLKIIAADGSKIGKTHCFTSIPINKIDVLVTDSSADKNELAKISSIGIRVILADQES
jgi:DeoR family fructose operon transcriptional repressor